MRRFRNRILLHRIPVSGVFCNARGGLCASAAPWSRGHGMAWHGTTQRWPRASMPILAILYRQLEAASSRRPNLVPERSASALVHDCMTAERANVCRSGHCDGGPQRGQRSGGGSRLGPLTAAAINCPS